MRGDLSIQYSAWGHAWSPIYIVLYIGLYGSRRRMTQALEDERHDSLGLELAVRGFVNKCFNLSLIAGLLVQVRRVS